MDVRPEKPNESPHHHECSGCGSRALRRVRRQRITDRLLAAVLHHSDFVPTSATLAAEDIVSGLMRRRINPPPSFGSCVEFLLHSGSATR